MKIWTLTAIIMSMGTFESNAGASFIVIDEETGEVVADRMEFKRKSVRYAFPGGWAIVGLICLNRISDIKLPADGYRLAMKIMGASSYGGHVHKSNEDFAEELGVDKTRVSRLIGKLHSAGLVHRIGPKAVFINPGYYFRGTAEAQHQALEEWNKLRLPGLKRSRKRRPQ